MHTRPVIIVGVCIRWFILLLLFAVYLYALFLGTGNVSHGGSCFFDTQCKENTNLKCENFRCLCNKTARWINQKCIIVNNKSSSSNDVSLKNDLRASFNKQFKLIEFRNDVEFRNFDAVHYNNESYYYVSDYRLSRVLVYSSNWTYKSYFSVTSRFIFMRAINDSVYLSQHENLEKRNLSGSLIHSSHKINFSAFGVFYFDRTLQLLFVVTFQRSFFPRIEAYNTDLKEEKRYSQNYYDFSTCRTSSTNISPSTINGYNGNLYVGTESEILVFALSGCYQLLETNCKVTSIVFDDDGYMAYSCLNDASIYLYHSNGTSLTQSIKLPKASEWTYLGFDLNKNLIIVTANDIYKLI